MLLSFFFIWLSVCCPDWVISIILSSRSLIRSSALFILLFIAFRSAFVSVNEFSNFSWFLFIVLQYSAFLSIAFLNSFSIFVISFLNSVSIRLKRSVSLFFQGNSLGLLTGSCSSASSFYLHFSYSVSLGETVVYCGLGGLFICGGLIYLVAGLFLVWMPVVSFFSVC